MTRQPTTTVKHRKPRPDFPLTPHPRGQWCKKVRGRLHYFGPIKGDEEGEAALREWLRQRDDLYAGLPPGRRGVVSLGDLANQFLDHKHLQVEAGELSARTFDSCRAVCRQLVGVLGRTRAVTSLGPDDFARLRSTISARCGLERTKLEVVVVRSVFGFGVRQGILKEQPRFGESFEIPSAAVLRRARASKPPRLFQPAQLLELLEQAPPDLRAWILLGLNCGFGASDLAHLRHHNITDSWVTFPRPKTGVLRRCWLWAETREALSQWAAVRPKAKTPDDDGRVFLRPSGGPWVTARGSACAISNRFSALLRDCGMNGDGIGMYRLRHLHRHVTDAAADPAVADLLMGHADQSMASHYRGAISDDRIRAVCEHVRQWLYP